MTKQKKPAFKEFASKNIEYTPFSVLLTT